MDAGSGAPPGELEELLTSLAAIEARLKTLQENIAPLIGRLGINLEQWAYSLGDGYRAEAEALYRELDTASQPGGAYTYQQLASLEAADRLARKGRRAEAVGRAVALGARSLQAALEIFAKHEKNKKIEELVNQEKARLPWARDQMAAAEAQVKSCLELENSIFGEYAGRRPVGRSGRREVERRLDETVESIRLLAALRARLEYCRKVYQAVEDFQSSTPWQVEQSKQRLNEAAVQSLAASQVLGEVYFLNTLDRLIGRLDWQSPYYQNGLPAGVSYFLRHGRRRLPPGENLSSLDRHVERLRSENPPPARPLEFLRALRGVQRETGSLALAFGWRTRRLAAALLLVAVAAAVLLLSTSGLGGRILAALRQAAASLPWLNPGNAIAVLFFLILFAGSAWAIWYTLRKR